jgi:hypothetical protein
MNNYCCNLQLPVELFEPEIDVVSWLQSHQNFRGHFNISPTSLNPAFVIWLNNLGLSIRLVEVFYRTPNSKCLIHIDTAKSGDFAKLNWVYGGGSAVMTWYEEKDNSVVDITTTPINSKALLYQESQVTLVHSQLVGTPSLVQVGVPHSVVGVTEDRFCICVVFVNTKTLQKLTFQQALTLFQSYIKEL